MTMKVGLSGFGRIGRDVLRIYFENEVDDFEIVAL
ncbi:MAG: type I glyceraldehyde-3-phosphate dehydrogenase, partial [Tissierellia bacterium]|nr:type I glyceraldehyde-3-phosphate dehydrogenase [Tissierellia bacterium]